MTIDRNINYTIWHPLTQHATAEPEVHITGANGAYLHAQNNRRILDAVSSWWTITHGHNHPRLQQTLKNQADRLDHVMFAGFTHDAAESCAAALSTVLDKKLNHYFFSDSGSTANEVAIKMAIGAWYHRGQPQRTKIVTFDKAYHGATLANTALGGRGVFSTPYEQLLFDVCHIPSPTPANGDATIAAFKTLVAQHGNNIAMLMVEPIIMGAGGMIMYDAAILNELYALAKQHDIFVCFDEVMTGWGRTGTLFAYQQTQIIPDIITLGKGITGGILPMGLTAASDEIYAAFYADDRSKMLFHSTSFAGNPFSAAVAAENIAIWRDEKTTDKLTAIEHMHRARLPLLAGRIHIENPRIHGTIAAFDLPQTGAGYFADCAPRLMQAAMRHNVLLRPLGNIVYIMPPYCITETDMDFLYATLAAIITECAD